MHDFCVVLSAPNRELKLCEFFINRGFGDAFSPMAEGKNKLGNTYFTAVLPGYVFCAWHEERDESWGALRSSAHFGKVLVRPDANGLPRAVTVAPAIVSEWIEREAKREFSTVIDTRTDREKLIGVEIRIPYGPFVGHVATITGFHRKLVLLTVQIFGHPQTLQFAQDKIDHLLKV